MYVYIYIYTYIYIYIYEHYCSQRGGLQHVVPARVAHGPCSRQCIFIFALCYITCYYSISYYIIV